MNSHTVPRFLLDQFAYDDAVTKTRRLWCYEKGKAPFRGISPKAAASVDGHFSDPANANREAELESRLNREVENPVHRFLRDLQYRAFVLSPLNIRQLTRYVTLLWNRSQNRRGGTKQQVAISIESTRAFLADEEKVRKVAARWTMEIIRLGHPLERPVSVEEVRQSAEKMIATMQTQEHEQTTYVDSMERAMASTDETLEKGMWNVIHTDRDHPFAIGDAPVVTWHRNVTGVLFYGQGMWTADVEAVLPVGPTACLHILPAVQRTCHVGEPTPSEVNRAQGAFATRYCYAHKNDPQIDKDFQWQFSRGQIGVNMYSVRHRNYNDTMFEVLMSGGSSFKAPRR
jgi:Protein of unknown function (DUF4238)